MSRTAAPLRGAAQTRRLIRPMLRGWYRVEVVGEHNVPSLGPVLLVANHLGFLDPALLASSAPRPVRVMAAAEQFAPPLDKLMGASGQILTRLDAADRRAADEALAVLGSGQAVGIFPEARRGRGRVAHSRHFAAYLALRTGAPVVPAAILGTRATGMGRDALPRRRTRMAVVFGQPFAVSSPVDPLRRAVIAGAGESIRQQLADLVAAAETATGIRLPTDIPAPGGTNRSTNP